MRIGTWNIRYDSKPDPDKTPVEKSVRDLPDPTVEFPYLTLHGEQQWKYRRLRVAEMLLSEGIELVGQLSPVPFRCS